MSYGYNPPPWTGNLNVWATNVITYLQRVASRLAFKTDDARASENGIILYDNVNGYPVVSKDGEWRQIVLADGYAFLTQDNDVTAAAADTASPIIYDASSMSSGISLDGNNPERIVFEEGGTYLLAFSAQMTSTSSSTVDFYFWPRITENDVTGSTIKAALHQNDATFVVSRSAVFQMNAGDYLEVMWAVSSTSGYLQAAAATAFAPATPSTSLSITRIRA